MPEYSDLLGLALVVLGLLLLIGFAFLARQGFRPGLRPLGGYEVLARQVGQAVESGGRVHVSTGSGSVIGEDTITTLSALAVLDYVAGESSISDLSPVATTGDATALPVVADTVRRAYQRIGMVEKYDPTSARLVAPDPYAMAGGGTSIIVDDDVRANVLIGSFGPELTLLTEAGQRRRLSQVAGSDRVEAQAVAYAMAEESLIGEEVYVSRAYLSQEASATASLVVEDILRWLVVVGMIGGFVLTVLGIMR